MKKFIKNPPTYAPWADSKVGANYQFKENIMFQEMIITGAKSSKGEYEGRAFDSTKIYCQTKMNSEGGEMVGFATSEYNWG